MRRVKIFGAGSIGNHLAHAARRLGWSVTVCDVHQEPLDRMRTQVYPQRYGAWDDSIELCLNPKAPVGGFDWIFVGTPPESHISLALQALMENPRGLLLEKPLCDPSLEGVDRLQDRLRASPTRVFVGYTNAVSRVTQKADEVLRRGLLGEIQTIEVEFREHWEGIFRAHPWLKGPQDSYLGTWRRGGGATSEHSHGIHLWQHFAQVAGQGRITEVMASLDYLLAPGLDYDRFCLLHLRTDRGLIGRVVQDTVARPPRLRAFLYGTEGSLEWISGYNAQGDAVRLARPGQPEEILEVPKARADDFIEELRHIDGCLDGGTDSAISLDRGLETMRIIQAAHRSHAERVPVRIDDPAADGPSGGGAS